MTRIAARLDSAVTVAYNREFRIVEGSYGGKKIAICSTGIGSPSTAIAVEELSRLGVDRMVRVGTCGGLVSQLSVGDVCVSVGAVRGEGTTRAYGLPDGYPAVPDLDLTYQVYESAPTHTHLGVCLSNDAFYAESKDFAHQWAELHVTHVEMEAAALFCVGRLRNVRTASVCAVSDSLLGGEAEYEAGIDDAITAALEGITR